MKESYIKQLIRILQDSELDSLEISSFWGMSNIKLSKDSRKSTTEAPSSKRDKPEHIEVEEKTRSQHIEASPFKKETKESQDSAIALDDNLDPINASDLHFIAAPLVGTFYSSPKPEDPPFLKKGDKLEIGQTICIIEAMKIFNEIDAEISGTIEEILVESGDPVEYGQKIISIRLDD